MKEAAAGSIVRNLHMIGKKIYFLRAERGNTHTNTVGSNAVASLSTMKRCSGPDHQLMCQKPSTSLQARGIPPTWVLNGHISEKTTSIWLVIPNVIDKLIRAPTERWSTAELGIRLQDGISRSGSIGRDLQLANPLPRLECCYVDTCIASCLTIQNTMAVLKYR